MLNNMMMKQNFRTLEDVHDELVKVKSMLDNTLEMTIALLNQKEQEINRRNELDTLLEGHALKIKRIYGGKCHDETATTTCLGTFQANNVSVSKDNLTVDKEELEEKRTQHGGVENEKESSFLSQSSQMIQMRNLKVQRESKIRKILGSMRKNEQGDLFNNQGMILDTELIFN